MRTDYMGLRVARWRDIGGMTQQQLADAVGVTREYISMIENGKRPVTKRSLLIALARTLGVSVNDLTGQPYAPESPQELLIYGIASGVRQALDEDYDDLRPVDPGALATTAHRVRVARMACDYATLAHLLPDLAMQARLSTANADAIGLSVFVSATTDAAMAIKSHGHVDLAIRLADAARAA